MKLDPITVAALEVLNLKSDRLPTTPRWLAALVASKNPPDQWTNDKTAAYRHLRQVVGDAQKPDAAPAKPDGPKPREVAGQKTAGLSAKQVRRELCAS